VYGRRMYEVRGCDQVDLRSCLSKLRRSTCRIR
jgi:hypothetical protein